MFDLATLFSRTIGLTSFALAVFSYILSNKKASEDSIEKSSKSDSHSFHMPKEE
jgi:hypothetical protein